MGSPSHSSRNEALFDWAGTTIRRDIIRRFGPDATILDVGAGWGKYRFLLMEYPMDACEVWGPYIEEEGLATIYDKVFEVDICDFDFDHYDVVIFGDVFEHIERARAKELLDRILGKCGEVYIAVPYLYPQHKVNNNPYEEHKQADLTDDLMQREYPGLKLLAKTAEKGVYVKNN